MNSSQMLPFVEPQAKRPVHMILGQVGAVLAACVEFVAIPIFSSLIFAVFVITEMWNGQRSDASGLVGSEPQSWTA